MIAVLDPAWLVRTLPQDEAALVSDIDGLLRLCRAAGAELSAVEDYWDPLARELLRPLEMEVRTPRGREVLQALRREARHRDVPAFAGLGRVRGFTQMFRVRRLLSEAWEGRMARAMLRICRLGQPVVLLARPVVGRNIHRHGTGNLVLDEVTRWRLYVQPDTPEFVPVPCVRVPRHLELDWTTRFDHRLPTVGDGARYPFCPPANWDEETLQIVQTRSSKPAFIDLRNNAWTRPNIPGGRGYHWDVFIGDKATLDAVGVDQLNIVEFGAPPSEGQPGHLHHVPLEKEGKVHDVGWSCPQSIHA